MKAVMEPETSGWHACFVRNRQRDDGEFLTPVYGNLFVLSADRNFPYGGVMNFFLRLDAKNNEAVRKVVTYETSLVSWQQTDRGEYEGAKIRAAAGHGDVCEVVGGT